jgi:signal transduction histidine kinase
LLNLVNNGLKFNTQEIPRVTLSADWETIAGEDVVSIQVTDNGIGIPEDKRAAIFEIFKRLDKRSEFAGTGLGLASCKRIVDIHQGQIAVSTASEDINNPGSVFTIKLPQQQT